MSIHSPYLCPYIESSRYNRLSVDLYSWISCRLNKILRLGIEATCIYSSMRTVETRFELQFLENFPLRSVVQFTGWNEQYQPLKNSSVCKLQRIQYRRTRLFLTSFPAPDLFFFLALSTPTTAKWTISLGITGLEIAKGGVGLHEWCVHLAVLSEKNNIRHSAWRRLKEGKKVKCQCPTHTYKRKSFVTIVAGVGTYL